MNKAGWWGTLGVAGVLVALSVGLPVIDSAIAGDESLPTGTVLRLGPPNGKGVRPIRLTTTAGWTLRKGNSDLSTNLTLRKGSTTLIVSSVELTPNTESGDYPDAEALWKGLGRLVPLQWDGHLSSRTTGITSDQGVSGLTGDMTTARHVGIAAVFPDGSQGAEAVAAGPPGDFAAEADAVKTMIKSIAFSKGAGR
jgi:hypothetical protein